MFCKRLLRNLLHYSEYKSQGNKFIRTFHGSCIRYEDKNSWQGDKKEVVRAGSFEGVQDKTRNTYLEMIKIFINRDNIYRRGHVEFIYSALKNMQSFGVSKDLEVYKALIDVLPKGKFIPSNMFQAEFMHYPKQQQCIIDLLQQMEDNAVMPDSEMEALLLNIFGKRGHPLRKYWRMMYWMPKFKNLSPWPLPQSVPNDSLELAKLAIERIMSVDPQVKIKEYKTDDVVDSNDKTWVVSGQSPVQKRLLQEHDVKAPLYIEGAFRIWIRDKPVNYFILRANAKPFNVEDLPDPDDVSKIDVPLFSVKPPTLQTIEKGPSVHEQEDGVILAVCASGTSSKDSLLSWVRLLEKDGNPALGTVSVVFTLRSQSTELTTPSQSDLRQSKPDEIES